MSKTIVFKEVLTVMSEFSKLFCGLFEMVWSSTLFINLCIMFIDVLIKYKEKDVFCVILFGGFCYVRNVTSALYAHDQLYSKSSVPPSLFPTEVVFSIIAVN